MLVQIMPQEPKWPPAPGGHMFNIGLYRVNHENIFSSETTRPRAFIFGMNHHLVNLYKVV